MMHGQKNIKLILSYLLHIYATIFTFAFLQDRGLEYDKSRPGFNTLKVTHFKQIGLSQTCLWIFNTNLHVSPWPDKNYLVENKFELIKISLRSLSK